MASKGSDEDRKAKKAAAALAARKALAAAGMDSRQAREAPLPSLNSAVKRTVGVALPELHSVHRGTIVSIQAFGAFVQLAGGETYKDGLLHVSCISRDRVERVEDELTVGLTVWVKVSSVKPEEGKYSVDMRPVSQKDGAALPDSFGSLHAGATGSRAIVPGLKSELPLHSESVKSFAKKNKKSSESSSSSDSDDEKAAKRAKKRAKKALKKVKKAQKKARKHAKKLRKQAKRQEQAASGKTRKASSSSSSSSVSSVGSESLEVPEDILQALMKQETSTSAGIFASERDMDAGPCETGASLQRKAGQSSAAERSDTTELPDGWERRTSSSTGKHYYVNQKLGKTQWEMPTKAQAEAEEILARRRAREAERKQREEAQAREEKRRRLETEDAQRPFWAASKLRTPAS
eukprot:TRINITY_DN22437_c0_g1_i1.p1 TRINITY_DN22437_c0_g1~~TRINITY_DN22437_c0_g1_i1.p1  ORF type:complete len:406 (-),score=90.26 TRINITY_DN22437_c0_g1_i1:166-1383(-)